MLSSSVRISADTTSAKRCSTPKAETSARALAQPLQTQRIRMPVRSCPEQPGSRGGTNHLRLLGLPLGTNFGQRSCDLSLEFLCGHVLKGLSELLEDLEALGHAP